MATAARVLTVVVVALASVGCIPSTRATIAIGEGQDMAAMRRAETAVEKMGFVRQYYEDRSGAKLPTYTHEGSLISSYAAPTGTLGAAVVWRKTDGRLMVEFGERDTSFSPNGRATLETLVGNLREAFGQSVALVVE